MHTKNYIKTYGDGTATAVTRYVADEGKAFFDGANYYNVVDNVTGYTEVDEPPEDDELTAEEALDIITGGAK